ncbi:MAG: CapA family protein [Muribaculaceae bacterium]|nr:CapA family protein [Muribaculaceae bacterium]
MWSLVYAIISLFGCTTVSLAPQQAVLVFVGDAMQHQAQLDKAHEIGRDKYDYSECFTLIAPAISEADYAVCNLEVPLGGPPNYSGYPCFSAPDSFAEALKDAGFDMMLTANNHCLDRRDKAARRTLEALDSLKVDHIGTFHNIEERDSLVPFIKDINGFKIAFLNYTYGTNGIEPNDGIEVALIDKEKIGQEIAKARNQGAELIVVAMHWGIEYVLIENNVQRNLADFLIDSGADLIIGGHPHVVQPMKVVHNEKEDKDVLVVYSLGNFISNMKTADTRGGAMVWTTIERDENGKAKFKNAEYELIFAAKPEGKRNFRVIPAWEEDSIPSTQQHHWDIFKRGAVKILDKYNVEVPRSNKYRPTNL